MVNSHASSPKKPAQAGFMMLRSLLKKVVVASQQQPLSPAVNYDPFCQHTLHSAGRHP